MRGPRYPTTKWGEFACVFGERMRRQLCLVSTIVGDHNQLNGAASARNTEACPPPAHASDQACQAWCTCQRDTHTRFLLVLPPTTAAASECNNLLLLLLPCACTYIACCCCCCSAVGLGASGAVYFGANLEFPGNPLSQSVRELLCACARFNVSVVC